MKLFKVKESAYSFLKYAVAATVYDVAVQFPFANSIELISSDVSIVPENEKPAPPMSAAEIAPAAAANALQQTMQL
jgi:hypothetical protein